MAKYFFEYQDSIESIEIAPKDLKVWKESNPHLTLVTQSKLPKAKKDAYAKQVQAREVKKNRKLEEPSTEEKLDALMKWIFSRPDEQFTPELNSIAATCMSIKSKYPLED